MLTKEELAKEEFKQMLKLITIKVNRETKAIGGGDYMEAITSIEIWFDDEFISEERENL